MSVEELQTGLVTAVIETVGTAALNGMRPSVVYRPDLSYRDGAWWATLGSDGARHFGASGATPAAAMESFDILFSLNAKPFGVVIAEENVTSGSRYDPDTLAAVIDTLSETCVTPPREHTRTTADVVSWVQQIMVSRVHSLTD